MNRINKWKHIKKNMKTPDFFLQDTAFVDPLTLALTKTEDCVTKKRGLMGRTIYSEIVKYIDAELQAVNSMVFGEDWLLSRIFTASETTNKHISNMVGVYPQHDKTTLFLFAREISAVIYQHGFKGDVVDYFIGKMIVDLPKILSKKHKVKRSEEDYIITKRRR